MADRYWVGGTGLWTTTSTTVWSATSGGASGASVPTAADNVFFDQAGTRTITLANAGLACLDITVSAGTHTFTSTGSITISGSMSLVAATVWSAMGALTFNATTAKTISTNGVTINGSIVLNGVAGSWQLQNALTVGPTRTVTLTNGTLDLQSYTLTVGGFSSSGSTARTIAFGTGNITVNGAGGNLWNASTVTNLTTTGSQIVNVSNNTASATTITSGSPTEANSISFNFTTGTYVLTLTLGSKRNLNFTGFAGSVNNSAQTIYGDLNLGSTATFTGGSLGWTFAATSGSKTITSSGKTMDFPLTFNGAGGTWVLQDALTMGSSRGLLHSNGTLDLSGKTLTVGTEYRTGTGTKNLTFNGGTLVCPASSVSAFINAVPTGFTTTVGTGTGTISMTGATAKTFVGGGSTFNCTLNQGGLGALTITGANTFSNITNTVQPASVLFTAATTTTFNNFNLNGTLGNPITISSATAATHTLSKTSGTVSCDYLVLTNSIATGGAAWYAGANSTNVTGNSGWIFTAPPGPSGNNSAFFSIL